MTQSRFELAGKRLQTKKVLSSAIKRALEASGLSISQRQDLFAEVATEIDAELHEATDGDGEEDDGTNDDVGEPEETAPPTTLSDVSGGKAKNGKPKTAAPKKISLADQAFQVLVENPSGAAEAVIAATVYANETAVVAAKRAAYQAQWLIRNKRAVRKDGLLFAVTGSRNGKGGEKPGSIPSRILGLLASGPKSSGSLIASLEMDGKAVYRAAARLVESGKAVRAGNDADDRAVYALPPKATQVPLSN